MLDRLYLSLPKEALSKERFEMPAVESMVQGTKTIIRNFSKFAKDVHRDEKHLFKYITKEIATAATITEGRLVLNGKFGQIQISKLFENYVGQYVLCHECKKPDTKIMEQQGVRILKCEACGALSPVKKL